MDSGDEGERDLTVALSIREKRVRLDVTVPAGPTRPRRVLPALRVIAHAMIEYGVAHEERGGKSISCRAGCSACCRQVIPLSETEARSLADLVATLDEPRRTALRARFRAVREKLAAAGLLVTLRNPASLAPEDTEAFALAYFRAGVDCPFLESGSCSIYADRPIACREYLVTSPAENCSAPSASGVRGITLPGLVSKALMSVDTDANPSGRAIGWVPLVLAPEWTATHPDDGALRTGREIVERVLTLMRQQSAGAAKGATTERANKPRR